MANISISNITKKFGKNIALDDISIEVKDKEFFVLFGPAGAGKTTILKTIAGIEFPNSGVVKFDDKIMNLVDPAERNVSMVFENYALYPHISAFDNIASPMRSPLHKESEDFIKEKVLHVAKLMKIDHLMDRLPAKMSNGQRQRVALGRCLVRKPNVFLMDEPLAHLDAKLRHFMRAELKEMQSNFDTTTIYVTHDYMEALSLGDRIAVINHGKIEQIGTGSEVYYTPKNIFVSQLFGDPEINIIDIALKKTDNRVLFSLFDAPEDVALPEDVEKKLLENPENHCFMGIRPIDISFSTERSNPSYVKGTVYSVEPMGNKAVLNVKISDQILRLVAPNDFDAEMDSDIYICLNIENAMFFDHRTENLIVRHNQKQY